MKALILGGTGTLGRELARQLLLEPDHEVTVFSRCELKQKEMEYEFKNTRLHFVLGDIRDYRSLGHLFLGFDSVFHVAALKHVDSLEFNPEESVKTNILGTINVANAAIQARVKKVVFSSTDKAVDPVNVYGMSKGISERILFRKNEIQSSTRFSVYRWGNVIGSRGSVVHALAESLLSKNEVNITDPDMTRFWIRIEDAVHFILSTYQTGDFSRPRIPDIKAAPLLQVVSVVATQLGVKSYDIKFIGKRRGEKVHEALISAHEPLPMVSNDSPTYTDSELADFLAPVLAPYRKRGAG